MFRLLENKSAFACFFLIPRETVAEAKVSIFTILFIFSSHNSPIYDDCLPPFIFLSFYCFYFSSFPLTTPRFFIIVCLPDCYYSLPQGPPETTLVTESLSEKLLCVQEVTALSRLRNAPQVAFYMDVSIISEGSTAPMTVVDGLKVKVISWRVAQF